MHFTRITDSVELCSMTYLVTDKFTGYILSIKSNMTKMFRLYITEKGVTVTQRKIG